MLRYVRIVTAASLAPMEITRQLTTHTAAPLIVRLLVPGFRLRLHPGLLAPRPFRAHPKAPYERQKASLTHMLRFPLEPGTLLSFWNGLPLKRWCRKGVFHLSAIPLPDVFPFVGRLTQTCGTISHISSHICCFRVVTIDHQPPWPA